MSELKTANYTTLQLKTAGYNITNLINAEYTIRDLSNVGYFKIDFSNAGYTALQLKDASYTALQLKTANYTLTELKPAGYTASDLLNAGYKINDLYNAGYTATDLQILGYSAYYIKTQSSSSMDEYPDYAILRAGYSAAELRNAEYPPVNVVDVSYSFTELIKAGYGFISILTKKYYRITTIRDAGYDYIILNSKKYNNNTFIYTATELKAASYNATELKNVGYSITDLSSAGYTTTELRIADYNATELKNAGYTLSQLKTAGYTATELRIAGYMATQLIQIKYDNSEILHAGYTAIELKNAGYYVDALYMAGYSPTDLINAGFTKKTDQIFLNNLCRNQYNINKNELNKINTKGAFNTNALKYSNSVQNGKYITIYEGKLKDLQITIINAYTAKFVFFPMGNPNRIVLSLQNKLKNILLSVNIVNSPYTCTIPNLIINTSYDINVICYYVSGNKYTNFFSKKLQTLNEGSSIITDIRNITDSTLQINFLDPYYLSSNGYIITCVDTINNTPPIIKNDSKNDSIYGNQSILITGLTPNSIYFITLQTSFKKNQENVLYNTEITTNTKGSPSIDISTNITDNSVLINWTTLYVKPTYYIVTYNYNNITITKSISNELIIIANEKTNYTLTGLVNDTSYNISLSSYYSDIDMSYNSNILNIFTLSSPKFKIDTIPLQVVNYTIQVTFTTPTYTIPDSYIIYINDDIDISQNIILDNYTGIYNKNMDVSYNILYTNLIYNRTYKIKIGSYYKNNNIILQTNLYELKYYYSQIRDPLKSPILQ